MHTVLEQPHAGPCMREVTQPQDHEDAPEPPLRERLGQDPDAASLSPWSCADSQGLLGLKLLICDVGWQWI